MTTNTNREVSELFNFELSLLIDFLAICESTIYFQLFTPLVEQLYKCFEEMICLLQLTFEMSKG